MSDASRYLGIARSTLQGWTSKGEGLIEGATGQRVMREIVEDYLQYVTRDEDGYPRLMGLKTFLPSKAVVDPWRAFGQPIFESSGTRVGDVAAMLRAGEGPEAVADELGVTSDEVRAAARVVLLPGESRVVQRLALLDVCLADMCTVCMSRETGVRRLTLKGIELYGPPGTGRKARSRHDGRAR